MGDIEKKKGGRPWRRADSWPQGYRPGPFAAIYAGLLAAGLAAAAAVYFVLVHDVPGMAKDRADTMKTALLVIGGSGALAGLYVSYRKQRTDEASHLRDQDKLFTERYTAAVAQLGHGAAVRIGGVYALARIADDSARDRPTCLEVLCAYLRMPYDPDDPKAEPAERQVRITAQTAIAARLRPDHPGFWADAQIDLSGAYLIEARFEHIIAANFKAAGATFSGEAIFNGATFSGQATFGGASFSEGAFFRDATFGNEATFTEARFNGYAVFDEATFSGGATLSGASFGKDSTFQYATFIREARFDRAVFDKSAFFGDARFSQGVRLDAARFSGDARFDTVTFDGDAWFDTVTFDGDAWFDTATFGGDARFDRARFNERAMFESPTFDGVARFNLATFIKVAIFGKTMFGKNARFDQATFHASAVFTRATFGKDARFDRATFYHSADFGEAIFNGNTEFDTATFSRADPPVWPQSFVEPPQIVRKPSNSATPDPHLASNAPAGSADPPSVP